MADNQSPAETDFDATLRAIQDAYLARLPERLQAIADSLCECERQPASAPAVDTLLRHLHTLAGSAGTFGLGEMGMRATELELTLNAFVNQGMADKEGFAPIAAQTRKFLHWAKISREEPTIAAIAATEPTEFRHAAMPATVTDRLIYLVHDDAAMAREIAGQLHNFGYEVRVIDDLSRLQEQIDARIPAAVMMDLGFPTGILAGATEVARIKKANDHRFAVIFISTRSNFEARLATVKAGADGYFSKPLDMVAVIDRLDALLVREEPEPYRILVVDDDSSLAEYFSGVLRGAGMEVRVLESIPGLLDMLGDFRPELILMDVHMDMYNGIDLARLIRQDNMYLDVPIVFLSSESDIETQFHAIESGGDDFLSKPIGPAHLVSAVGSRVRRYRALRSLIMRDSLTGLFNHSAIKEHLQREIARARRSGVPLTLAMVDIDLFKDINDTYGHPVGDQVIRALSRLLQQRLRRGDIIGRYGGEEFALIMPGTSAVAAAGVLDQIRESFGQILHHAESLDFGASFSAGLAELAPDIDAETLFRLADVALYQAKHDGRNCIRA